LLPKKLRKRGHFLQGYTILGFIAFKKIQKIYQVGVLCHPPRVELLPSLKFTGKMVKKINFTGKIGKNGKNGKNENAVNIDAHRVGGWGVRGG
jgi:hypothetical protein